MRFPKFAAQSKLPKYDPENVDTIWDDISRFKQSYPEGKLVALVVKDMNWYYNEWGPEQTDTALCAVLGVLQENKRDVEGFGYRSYGRWLLGFYKDGAQEKIEQGIRELVIENDGLQPATVPLKDKTIELNPAKVEVEFRYVEVNSKEDLFKKKE